MGNPGTTVAPSWVAATSETAAPSFGFGCDGDNGPGVAPRSCSKRCSKDTAEADAEDEVAAAAIRTAERGEDGDGDRRTDKAWTVGTRMGVLVVVVVLESRL